jgi:hypothetical protein
MVDTPEDWIAQAQRQRAAATGFALAERAGTPDQAAEALRLGADLGIHPGAVSLDPDLFRKRAEARRNTMILQDAPRTATWLRDQLNGTLAKDDLQTLTAFEKWGRGTQQQAYRNAAGSTLGGIVSGVERGARRMPAGRDSILAFDDAALAADIGKTFDDIYREELSRLAPGAQGGPDPFTGIDPMASAQAQAMDRAMERFGRVEALTPADRDVIVRRGAERLQKARERLATIGEIPMSEGATAFRDGPLAGAENSLSGVLGAFAADPVGGAQFLIETAAEALPTLAGAAAVTALTRSPGAGAAAMGAGSFNVTASQTAMELLAERGADLSTPEAAMAVLQDADLMAEARRRGAAKGVVVAIFDAVSGGVAGKALSKSPLGDALLQGVAQGALGAGGEAAGQIAAAQDRQWADIVLEGLAEFVTAPVEAIGVGGRKLGKTLKKAAEAQTFSQQLAEIDALAAGSALKERSPEKFAEALEAQGLGEKYLHVEAEALREYFQAKDVTESEMLDAWGIEADAFEAAWQTGTRVAVPVSTYAARIVGTGDEAFFAQNASFDPEGLTAADAARVNEMIRDVLDEDARLQSEMQRAELERQSSDAQVFDDLNGQLRAAGQSPDVAKTNATMLTAFFRATAARVGEDPLDLFRSLMLRVRGPMGDQPTRRRGQMDVMLNTLRAKGDKAVAPRGQSLTEFVRARGGVVDEGGDVAALEPGKGIVSETAGEVAARRSQPNMFGPGDRKGEGMDDMGRAAIAAGYFPELMGKERDPEVNTANLLIDALAAEARGEKRYIPGEEPDPEMAALRDELQRRGIDLGLSNDEIVAALDQADDGQTYNQDRRSFQQMVADAKARIAARNEMADRIAAEGRPVVMSNGGGLRALVGPNTIKGEKPFRVTYLGDDGKPNGHVEADTLRAAAIRAMEDGFWPVDQTYNQPAYHGSPHLFDRFSTEKIGTGEGAQAYGFGLYFAGRKGVAEYYRDTLSHRAVSSTDFPNPTPDQLRALVDIGNNFAGSDFSSISEIDKDVLAAWADAAEDNGDTATAEFYRQLDPASLRMNSGRLYKVDIPEDSDLLDWDRPLSEQPEKVRDKLLQMAERLGLSKRQGVPTGSVKGQLLYDALEMEHGSPRAASEALRTAGIPGHRYADQGSRIMGLRILSPKDSVSGKWVVGQAPNGPNQYFTNEADARAAYEKIWAEQTHNYVIYDDAAVRVLEFEQNQSGPRGSVVFPQSLRGGETIINLFETADLSTTLHESAHFFLEAYTALSSEAGAPADLIDDMATIRAFLGNDGSPWTVEQHEKFARAGEAYFLEGKAPSLALADVFSRFKAWLTRIYRDVRGLNVKLNPEIRDVFDRMLATEAEIAAARDEAAMKPLFSEAPRGMADGDWATYQRIARRATEAAEQTLLERTMAKVRREREAWFREERKATRDEVAKEYANRREYQLIEAMTASDGPQINRKMLEEQFGKGVTAEMTRQRLGGKRAIYGDGENTVTPQEAADLFGFANAVEMVEVLQNTGKFAEAVAAETDRRMDERHGDPLNDGSIEAEALEAVHNEQQAMTAMAEARHLAKMAGRSTRNMTATIWRARARAMLTGMTVRDVMNPGMFLNAERKAARAAEKAFAAVARGNAGKLPEAMQAKEQQVLNGFLYSEARSLEKKIGAFREKARDYAKAKVRQKIGEPYIDQIDVILEDFDFRVRSGRQIRRAESLTAFVDQMVAEGREGELAIDERLITDARKRHYTRLSVDELRGVMDTVTNLDHLGRFKGKLIEKARLRALAETVDGVTAAMDANMKDRPPHRVETKGERLRTQGREILNWTLNADTLLREADGRTSLGTVWTAIKQPIDEGLARLTERRIQMGDDLRAIYGVYSGREQRAMSVKKANRVLGDLFSKWDIISIALNTGNEDNYQRLTNPRTPGHFSPEQVEAALLDLDERDWRFVQSVWDYTNSFWPEIEAKQKRQTGVAPEKVQAKLMVNAPGFVTGGYYPIRYDSRLASRVSDNEMNDLMKDMQVGRLGKAQTRHGHTKERVENVKLPVRLGMGLWHQHLDSVIYDLELGEAVNATHQVLNHDDVRAAFREKGRSADHMALDLWLRDVASGDRIAAGGWERVFRYARTGFVVSRLGFNIATALIQPTGLAQSAVVVGKKAVAKGMLDYVRNPARWVADVTAASPMMRERKNTFERDVMNALGEVDTGPVSGVQAALRYYALPASFWLMQQTQFYAVDMPTWVAAYQKEIAATGDEAKARTYADLMVKRAQGSGLMADRGMLERGTTKATARQQQLPMMLTALGSYMFAKFNVAYERTGATNFRNPIEAMAWAADMALLFTFEATVYAAINGFSNDDEDEGWAEWLAEETGMGIAGTIPAVREVASALEGFNGGGALGAITTSTARAAGAATDAIGPGDFNRADIKALIDAAGIWLHLPSSQTNKIINGLLENDLDLKSPPEIGTMLGIGSESRQSPLAALIGN